MIEPGYLKYVVVFDDDQGHSFVVAVTQLRSEAESVADESSALKVVELDEPMKIGLPDA